MPVPPSYQRYPQRFQAATQTWDPFEVGCYTNLLDAQWELGDRGLPDDLDRLAATVRCPFGEIDRFRKAWSELLEEKFPVGPDGRRRNPPLEKIRREQEEYRRRRSEAGKAGAAVRHGKRTGNRSSNATGKGGGKQVGKTLASDLRSPVSDLPLRSPISEAEGARARPTAAEEDPVIFEFPCRVSRRCAEDATWPLRRSKLEEYIEAFPGVDVQSEIREALQWCRDNPPNRKTLGGMPRFLNGWLNSEAEKARAKEPDPGYSEREMEAMT